MLAGGGRRHGLSVATLHSTSPACRRHRTGQVLGDLRVDRARPVRHRVVLRDLGEQRGAVPRRAHQLRARREPTQAHHSCDARATQPHPAVQLGNGERPGCPQARTTPRPRTQPHRAPARHRGGAARACSSAVRQGPQALMRPRAHALSSASAAMRRYVVHLPPAARAPASERPPLTHVCVLSSLCECAESYTLPRARAAVQSARVQSDGVPPRGLPRSPADTAMGACPLPARPRPPIHRPRRPAGRKPAARCAAALLVAAGARRSRRARKTGAPVTVMSPSGSTTMTWSREADAVSVARGSTASGRRPDHALCTSERRTCAAAASALGAGPARSGRRGLLAGRPPKWGALSDPGHDGRPASSGTILNREI